ncbi:MAG: LacI family DNA-binding transcriptional regulator [Kiritimatiellae bacterium]|nr:LacI family DNA-binding transcriptional regulator [Kiritimatiellia bacterium]
MKEDLVLSSTRLAPTGPTPLYRQIRQAIQDHVARLTPGDRVTTEMDLCKLFKVSRMTANRALNDLAEDNLVTRVRGKGTFVSARPKTIIKHKAICILTPHLGLALDHEHSPNHYDIISAMEKNFGKQGFNLNILTSRFALLRPETVATVPAAAYVVVYAEEQDMPLLNAIRATGRPMVTVNSFLTRKDIDQVNDDVHAAGCLATRHLIKNGYEQIAFVGNQPPLGGAWVHYKGYETTVIAAGRRPAFFGVNMNSDEKTKGDIVAQILQAHNGIVTGSDDIGALVVKVATALGRRIPKDVGVTGYFDSPLCAQVNPQLTSIRLSPPRELGIRTAIRLNDLMRSPGNPPKNILMPVKLVGRESSHGR